MPKSISRKIIVYGREVFVKLAQFRGSFLWFVVAIMSAAITLKFSFDDLGWIESVYQAITLMFFATDLAYPKGRIYLELLWIIYPMITLLIVLDGLSGFGQAIKFGDVRSEEWNLEMSKILENHIIVVGMGNLGVRVANELVKSEWDFNIVDKEGGEHEDRIHFYREVHRVPVIVGDATVESVLEKAQIKTASSIMVLIDDDLLNLKIAMKARKLNPNIHIVLRMFDIEFGKELADELNFSLFSTTKLAVDAFMDEIRRLKS